MDYIVLPVLFSNQNTNLLKECNISFKLTDCTVMETAFFTIDAVVPFLQDGIEYSQVHISGNVFYSTLTMDEVLDLIDCLDEGIEPSNN
jgi:hypothetical protein